MAKRFLPLLLAFSAMAWAEPRALAGEGEPRIEVALAKGLTGEAVSGRLFVVFSAAPPGEGPPRLNWFKPEPFFAQDVVMTPGKPHRFAPTAGLPPRLLDIPAGKRYAQAVLDRDLGGQSPLSSPGNFYSKPMPLELGKKPLSLSLTLDRIAPARAFSEKEHVKLADIPSPLLSAFHGKPMRLRAGVLLPHGYFKEEDRRYPVIYEITGFGGDHHHVDRAAARNASDVAGVPMIHVTLDATCRLGHHVFADSANNGPVGRALVEELIPHIEKTYRAVGSARARFVTGHSSGGWSSLWLQITYPDFFGGCWATAPDSVDFRDFQQVNIYETEVSLLFDSKGMERPLGRKGGKPVLFYKPFSDMEVVLGRGGQLFSFEAVFSPKGKDGRPRPLYDRISGRVDPLTAEAWKNYDINLVLRRDWDRLGPKLARKLHVYMGAEDTYYLDGATRLLKKTLEELRSDAVVEIFPGKDHSTLLTPELRQRIAGEMAARFLGK